MKLLAVDPGTTRSAFVALDGRTVLQAETVENGEMLRVIRAWTFDMLVLEQVAGMGMAVGAEVFETCVWTGRFIQAREHSGGPWDRVTRRDVKLHLCGNMRARDANIRQRLIDLYGGKAAAVGKKAAKGPLYGVSGDQWSALAVGVTWLETVRRT